MDSVDWQEEEATPKRGNAMKTAEDVMVDGRMVVTNRNAICEVPKY